MSYIATPSPGQLLTYVPTFPTGFTSGSEPTNVTAKYTKIGRLVTVIVNMTNGTSNSTAFTMTAPILSDSYIQNGVWATAADNGSNLTAHGRIRIAASTTTFDFYVTATTGAWTAAFGKGISFSFSYFSAT